MKSETAFADADNLNWETVTGGKTLLRERWANLILCELTPEEIKRARLEECSDEKTGRRYGLAEKRRGKAKKIGGGGRNRGSRYAYQVWLVWD